MSVFTANWLADAPGSPAIFMSRIFGENPSVFSEIIFDVAVVAMFCIWWERKVAGHIQSRLGPNRVGPIGILQSLADGIKLLLKEDLIPTSADHFLYRLAPYLAFAPAFAV